MLHIQINLGGLAPGSSNPQKSWITMHVITLSKMDELRRVQTVHKMTRKFHHHQKRQVQNKQQKNISEREGEKVILFSHHVTQFQDNCNTKLEELTRCTTQWCLSLISIRKGNVGEDFLSSMIFLLFLLRTSWSPKVMCSIPPICTCKDNKK